MANKKFQNAMAREAQAVPPVWMMRQAGRYHKHYQALRRQNSFMDLCKKPELAAEVAMGPIRDFDFDVAILFSDLLFPLEALGMGLEYKDTGPELAWRLNRGNVQKLKSAAEAVEDLRFQGEAVKKTRAVLPQDKSLIGFVGGPWTLFAYAVEGSHKGSLLGVRAELGAFSSFCEVMVPLLIKNIEIQIDAGAEVVMIFDTAAGEISPALYQEIVVPQLEKIAKKFPAIVGYYAKGTVPKHHDHPLFHSGLFAGIGVDHRWDLADAFSLSNRGFVQGNFDQGLLCIEAGDFQKHLHAYAESIKKRNLKERAAWVSGLGHGILPQAKEENVRYFVSFIREFFHG